MTADIGVRRRLDERAPSSSTPRASPVDDESNANYESTNRGPWFVAAFSLLAIGGCVLTEWPQWTVHRVPPTVRGALFRVGLPEAGSFLSRRLIVFAIDRAGPAIAALEPGDLERPPVLVVHRFPTGELLERREHFTAADVARVEAARTPSGEHFDFDGDGVADRIDCALRVGNGLAEVRSGADDRVLFVSDEPLEYESSDRLTFLGDLDGDGGSELAVWHPRRDRSKYDFEPLDRWFGAKSWLSVVSGKLATDPQR